MSEILDIMKELYPDAALIYPTGYEDCIIGIDMDEERLVMDTHKIIDKLIKKEGMSRMDAVEFFDYNIIGSKGKGYPIYLQSKPI